jgi:MFS family permease
LTFIKSLPEFFIMLGVAVIANFALSPVFSVALPVVILQDFGISEDIYGLLTSLMMIGSFIAPMFAVKIIRKHHYSKLVSAILTFDAVIISLISIFSISGLFSSVWINIVSIILLLNILMMTIVVVNLGITTARQLMVPGDMMGRVSSVLGAFGMMAMPIGQAIMGSLLDTSKSYIIIAIYACLLLLSGVTAKIGFTKLAKSGKMDTTIGVTPQQAKVLENVV